ncbi:MAG TPA: methyltransferase domain-containing protein [Candidatus Cybelea sp.]|jgi:ubiquinone/menaquinone biosynthesis C-methylase UbiE|nr:methyltransferase domain-containing protein [Candidatus Cybelea sp.]
MDLNPQAAQMADESMVRTLDAQARAIWPQESALFRRYSLPAQPSILDAGCGTGEIASRVATLFSQANVLGVDIINEHLERARERYGHLAPRLDFEHQSIFALKCEDAAFDLTLCRHVLHSIPQVERVLDELVRVTRPGGYLHLIAEDYGMLHFARGRLDPRDFWHEVPATMELEHNTDLFIGRNIYGMLAALGLQEITIDYVVVDTLRVERETFAAIIEAWRDGYVEAIGEATPVSAELAGEYFNQMIGNIRDPARYAVWMVPVIAARVSTAAMRERA